MHSNDPSPDTVDEPTLQPLAELTGVILPKKLTPENTKKALDNTVDFLRNNDVQEEDVDEHALASLTKVVGMPFPGGKASPRQKALDHALEWLRNNNPCPGLVEELALTCLTKLSTTPMPEKLSPEGKEAAVGDVVEHFRSKDVDKKDVDEPTLKAITKLAGVDLPRGMKSPRQKILDDTLGWLRKHDPSPDSIDESAMKPLAKLCSAQLPKALTRNNKETTLADIVGLLRLNELDEADINKPTMTAIINLAD